MLPDIYYYNPTCELAIANGDPNYQPPRLLSIFEKELGVLPMYFAKEADIILVKDLPPFSFIHNISEAGFPLPKFLKIEEALQNEEFIKTPKNFLFPWGWSPAAHKRLKILKPGCSKSFMNSPVFKWDENHKEIYSRKTALDILRKLLEQNNEKWLPPVGELPEVCISHQEIEKLQQNWPRLVVKSPWSASGRGLQFLRKGEYNRTNRQVIAGFLNNQGYVIAGPLYNKLADLSFHFYTKGKKEIEYRGQAAFITDNSGKYQGNYLSSLPENMNIEYKEFLKDKIPILSRMLKAAIEESPLSDFYHGWMGVDAILYKDEGNNLMVHPCLEINCRYNMGAMTLKLRENIAEGSHGEWRIEYGNKGSFMEKAEKLRKEYPVVLERGEIKEGFVSLTPEWPEGHFGAWMIVKN